MHSNFTMIIEVINDRSLQVDLAFSSCYYLHLLIYLIFERFFWNVWQNWFLIG